MGSSPSVPATPEVQAAPQEQDAAVVDARDEETRRRRAAAGRSSTLLEAVQNRMNDMFNKSNLYQSLPVFSGICVLTTPSQLAH
ncbi:hypothetical protein FSF95_005800 [Escherichia coli]|uniref:hypothetical protein n=1 Tax=Escherichia coli TaxID=562 RepID=UPI00155FCC8F|nr:hypothetical protein [Escherichia coli]MBC1002420.1 hypothetical protein [Escherichia coli]